MSVPKIAKAMNCIDDEFISEAESFVPQKSRKAAAIKIAAISLAACLILAIIFYPKPKPDFPITYTSTTSANAEVISVTDIYNHKVFGKYFPTSFAENYNLVGKVYIYTDNLEAEFYNHYNQDTISIIISPKKYFADVKTNVILYPESDSSDITSYIFVDMGEYIAKYSSEKCNLATLEGFDKMIESTK